MKPYFENKSGKLFHADCLDIMATLGRVDLILTDPPYGLSLGNCGANLGIKGSAGIGKTKKYNKSHTAWDTKRPDSIYFDTMFDVSINQIIWGANYFLDCLPPSRCYIVWYKRQGLPPQDFADCEIAWASYDRNAIVYNCRWHGFIRDSKEKKDYHPTQKPLNVMMFCLQEFSNSSELVLDPFAGSGTSLLAAQKLDHSYIGIEKSERFCEIAAKRLEQNALQLKLFAT